MALPEFKIALAEVKIVRIAMTCDQCAWAINSGGDNRDHTRYDAWNDADTPFQRYVENWPRERQTAEESVRQWEKRAVHILPQPCRLCQESFLSREQWLSHVNAIHGGLQIFEAIRGVWARVAFDSCKFLGILFK
eukprot:3080749-Karenia_brevis.AAC.1